MTALINFVLVDAPADKALDFFKNTNLEFNPHIVEGDNEEKIIKNVLKEVIAIMAQNRVVKLGADFNEEFSYLTKKYELNRN